MTVAQGDDSQGDGFDGPYAKQHRYAAKKSLSKSNVAPVPPVIDPERKAACQENLRLFLETYFPEAFPLAWSPGHLKIIASIQTQIREGGNVAIAMPRGSGKTTLILRAAIWAELYGHSPYVLIVTADEDKAKKLLRAVKSVLRFNEKLFEDFPEVCHPIRELQGQAINASKQHIDGDYTLIDWRDKVAQLPTVRGSKCSGSLIEVAGITSAARGAQVTLADGRVIRPTLVLVDDFQTRESAASPTQTQTRLAILNGDLAGMRGPDHPLTMLCACTVIYKGDGADQLLDRNLCPEWRGERYRMVEAWPEDERLWERYTELRLDAIRRDELPTVADRFYADNREQMDAGSAVAWPERKGEDQSAIQHAWNIRLRIGEEAFNSEYQNDPDDPNEELLRFPTADEIAGKINRRPRREAPENCEAVVAAIDVQSNHLWFTVVGFGDGYSGHVLDYGTWPRQTKTFYTKRALPRTFATDPRYADMDETAAIYAALQDLLAELAATQTWVGPAGQVFPLRRIVIDEGYQTDTVHQAIRQSPHGGLAYPAKGHGLKATSLPMADWVRKKGEPVPKHNFWRLKTSQGRSRALRTLHWDAFHWRTFVQQRLQTPMGGRGSLSLWGESQLTHRLLAQHLTSQYPAIGEKGSFTKVEWNHKPAKPDDDLFDCLSMACVAASVEGVLFENEAKGQGKRQMIGKGTKSLADYLTAG